MTEEQKAKRLSRHWSGSFTCVFVYVCCRPSQVSSENPPLGVTASIRLNCVKAAASINATRAAVQHDLGRARARAVWYRVSPSSHGLTRKGKIIRRGGGGVRGSLSL